jgi:hypothetical protein
LPNNLHGSIISANKPLTFKGKNMLKKLLTLGAFAMLGLLQTSGHSSSPSLPGFSFNNLLPETDNTPTNPLRCAISTDEGLVTTAPVDEIGEVVFLSSLPKPDDTLPNPLRCAISTDGGLGDHDAATQTTCPFFSLIPEADQTKFRNVLVHLYRCYSHQHNQDGTLNVISGSEHDQAAMTNFFVKGKEWLGAAACCGLPVDEAHTNAISDFSDLLERYTTKTASSDLLELYSTETDL